MKQCMLDTYDMPWEKYHIKFKETYNRIVEEIGLNEDTDPMGLKKSDHKQN
jgi:hypothetical protein